MLITREQNTANLQRLAHTVKCAGTKEERHVSLTIQHPVIEKRYCRVSFSNWTYTHARTHTRTWTQPHVHTYVETNLTEASEEQPRLRKTSSTDLLHPVALRNLSLPLTFLHPREISSPVSAKIQNMTYFPAARFRGIYGITGAAWIYGVLIIP